MAEQIAHGTRVEIGGKKMSTSVTGTTSDYWQKPTIVDSGSSASGADSLSTVDSFLKILASELQNQDPTEPVSNTEYVSQLAQFNSLQQMSSMNGSMSKFQAYSLIGMEVSYTATDSSGNTVSGTGTVKSVVSSDSEVYVMVDGNKVKLSSVTSVTTPTTTTTGTTSTGTSGTTKA